MTPSRSIAAGLAVLLFATPILAQEDKAQQLFKAGRAKADAGDHAGAAELMLEAYQANPLPTYLPLAAKEFRQAGDNVNAVKYFCDYLKQQSTGPFADKSREEIAMILTEQSKPADVDLACNPPVDTQPDTPTKPPPSEPPPPQPASSTSRSPGMFYGGIGAVAAGIGLLGFGGYYTAKSADYNDEAATATPDRRLRLDELGSAANRNAYIGFGVGAVAVGAGVVLIVLSKRKTEQSTTAWQPVVGPHGAGLLATLRF